MATAPRFLNDDGTASMATPFLASHHGLRRDLRHFARALTASDVASRAEALREEWKSYHAALHGHHTAEDTTMFPNMKKEHPQLAATIDKLTADHHRIDPLLQNADLAFAALPDTKPAAALITELSELLAPHLAIEEAEIVPLLRNARAFPTPANDAEAEMFAGGFAWCAYGVAPEVLAKLFAMLPESITSRLPAARAAFEARSERAFGSTKAGASQTADPDWI
jgi:Hemerythrin HHE cation binding domain